MSKNSKSQGSLRDQLQTHGVLLTKVQGLPSHPSQWQGDGIDHINVAMNAATQIGKWLNGRNSHLFHHPILGQFRSIENLSLFIRSESHADSIRMMENFTKIRDLIFRSGGLRKTTPNYRAVMVHSIYVRVLQNESLMKLLLESTLPFDSYSINNETMLRQRFEPSAFLCAGYTEIRNALKERRSPSLTRFLDNGVSKDADIYEGIMNQLTGDSYQGTAPEIIARFEEKRWVAYDAWCERQVARAAQAAEAKLKKEKAAQEATVPVAQEQATLIAETEALQTVPETGAVEVEETKPVIEEVGNVSSDTIVSEDTPEPDYPEGTRWYNPAREMSYVLVHLSTGNAWVDYSYLEGSVAFDVKNGRAVTFIKMPIPSQVMPVIMECWELGLFIQDPITQDILYPVITSVDAPVSLVSQKPERFELAEQDGRKVPSEEAVAELAAVPVAAIMAAGETTDAEESLAEPGSVTSQDEATVASESSATAVEAANSGLSEMQSSM